MFKIYKFIYIIVQSFKNSTFKSKHLSIHNHLFRRAFFFHAKLNILLIYESSYANAGRYVAKFCPLNAPSLMT